MPLPKVASSITSYNFVLKEPIILYFGAPQCLYTVYSFTITANVAELYYTCKKYLVVLT